MTTMRTTALLCFLLLATPAMISAGEMERRSRIELRMGLRNHGGTTGAATTVGPLGVEATAGSGDVFFSLGYSRWMREDVAGYAALGVMSVGASSRVGLSGVSQRSAAILPVIVGMRYYPTRPTTRTQFRPFLTAGAGPVTGFESGSEIGLQVVQKAATMTAFGCQAGAGLDVRMGGSVVMNGTLGYNLMTDFSEAVGGRRNYSGLEFGLGFGWQFGGIAEN